MYKTKGDNNMSIFGFPTPLLLVILGGIVVAITVEIKKRGTQAQNPKHWVKFTLSALAVAFILIAIVQVIMYFRK